ncbi:hypothetical protein C8Q70DRAFT_71631 [Cubamyces menziesii]|nr:hypothetical protein C8Q70DRAFT_71631 [Cubamyces menziesii]
MSPSSQNGGRCTYLPGPAYAHGPLERTCGVRVLTVADVASPPLCRPQLPKHNLHVNCLLAHSFRSNSQIARDTPAPSVSPGRMPPSAVARLNPIGVGCAHACGWRASYYMIRPGPGPPRYSRENASHDEGWRFPTQGPYSTFGYFVRFRRPQRRYGGNLLSHCDTPHFRNEVEAGAPTTRYVRIVTRAKLCRRTLRLASILQNHKGVPGRYSHDYWPIAPYVPEPMNTNWVCGQRSPLEHSRRPWIY